MEISIHDAARSVDTLGKLVDLLHAGTKVNTKDVRYPPFPFPFPLLDFPLIIFQNISKHKQDNSWTALHHAAQSGLLEAVKLLIENAGDVEATTNVCASS